jgi:alpha-tubulin suppressor-like RCC1 family protein
MFKKLRDWFSDSDNLRGLIAVSIALTALIAVICGIRHYIVVDQEQKAKCEAMPREDRCASERCSDFYSQKFWLTMCGSNTLPPEKPY